MSTDTQYSTWIPVPENNQRGSKITEIVENKRFQIRTDKKIDGNNDIRWTMDGGIGWFTFSTAHMTNAYKCGGGTEAVRSEDPFFKRAGDLTFLKSTSQLKIWFDDVLEVTWIYVDKDPHISCVMRKPLTGLQFKTPDNPTAKYDKVSTHYRFETGKNLRIYGKNRRT